MTHIGRSFKKLILEMTFHTAMKAIDFVTRMTFEKYLNT